MQSCLNDTKQIDHHPNQDLFVYCCKTLTEANYLLPRIHCISVKPVHMIQFNVSYFYRKIRCTKRRNWIQQIESCKRALKQFCFLFMVFPLHSPFYESHYCILQSPQDTAKQLTTTALRECF